jgi:hypothetical protein
MQQLKDLSKVIGYLDNTWLPIKKGIEQTRHMSHDA